MQPKQPAPDVDFHAFAEQFLLAGGGTPVEELLPKTKGRKRADIAFPDARVVIEIKSIINDRTIDPAVQEAMNKLLVEKGPAMGGPIIFGTVNVEIASLPEKLARNAYRLLAQRVQKEVTTANRQLRETVEDMGWMDAQGILLIIAPPMGINMHLIGWAVADALREGRNSNVQGLIMIECDAPDDLTRNLNTTFSAINEVPIRPQIVDAFRQAVRVLFRREPIGPLSGEETEEAFFQRYKSP